MPTNTKKKIFAISGSVRQHSTNHAVIQAIKMIAKDELDISLYEHLANLPAFNPDLENTGLPNEVKMFKQSLQLAAGVIICTPEYAHGVPGSLKNAIDWTVGTAEFSHKPTLLITASTDGQLGHKSLLETLKVLEAKDIGRQNLLIQFAQTKVSKEGIIRDENTLRQVKEVLRIFVAGLHAALR